MSLQIFKLYLLYFYQDVFINLRSKPMATKKQSKVIKLPYQPFKNDNQKSTPTDYSFKHYLKVCFWDKFFCFKGRARRKEYITFQLADLFIALCFYGALQFFGTHASLLHTSYSIVSTVLIVPLLSVTVRRFHDTGLSGWWCLLAFIPLITIAFLAIKDTEEDENQYGEIPEGKIFTGPSWTNYALPQTTNDSNVIPFHATKKDKTKRDKKSLQDVA